MFRTYLDAAVEGVTAIRSHPLRALLAGVAVAAAVATIATVIVALDGVGRFARASASRAFGGNTFVVAKVAAPGQISRSELELKLARNPDITRQDLRFLQRYAQGEVLYGPTASRRGSVSVGARRFDGAAIVGTTSTLARIRDLAIERGRFFSVDEETQAAQVTIIGATIADELFPGRDPLGARIRMAGRGFTVIGLQESQGTVAGASLDRNVWIPLGAFERAFGAPQTLQLLARSPAPDEDVDAVRGAEDHARVSMRARRQLQPGEADNFDILAPEAARDFVLVLSQRISVAAGPISAMALLAAIVVVTNTILVSVTQRTREIGVRRAVGATRTQILIEVLSESVVISLLGGAVGLALVYSLAAAAGAAGLDVELRASTASWSLFAAAMTGLLAGWYPARRATLIDVVDALRSE
jgi:putative ABC transport system permease protein